MDSLDRLAVGGESSVKTSCHSLETHGPAAGGCVGFLLEEQQAPFQRQRQEQLLWGRRVLRNRENNSETCTIFTVTAEATVIKET